MRGHMKGIHTGNQLLGEIRGEFFDGCSNRCDVSVIQGSDVWKNG